MVHVVQIVPLNWNQAYNKRSLHQNALRWIAKEGPSYLYWAYGPTLDWIFRRSSLNAGRLGWRLWGSIFRWFSRKNQCSVRTAKWISNRACLKNSELFSLKCESQSIQSLIFYALLAKPLQALLPRTSNETLVNLKSNYHSAKQLSRRNKRLQSTIKTRKLIWQC